MKQTTKSLVGLLALVAIAVGIGFAAAWAGRDEEKKAEQKEKSEKLFEGLEKAKVRALRIVKDGQTVVALSRKDDKTPWTVDEPVKADADEGAANGLIDSLVNLKQKKDLGDEKDGKQYGLEKAHLIVSAKLEDGKEQSLELGLDNPFDSTLYVRRGGDATIRVVDGFQKATFDKSLFDLREKKVAHLDDAAEVRSIEVSGVKAPFALQKDAGKWKIGGADADGSVADSLASTLKSLRATGVAAEKADKPAEYGLDKPKAVVKLGVGLAGGKDTLSRTLSFGQAARGAVALKTYAQRSDSPTVFEVDSQVLKDLDKTPFDLQDKQLTHVNREDVRKLELVSPAGVIEVARSKTAPADGGVAEENFTVVKPAPGPAKKWKLSSALYAIVGLRATSFEGPAPKKDLGKYGLDKPRTAALYDEKGKELVKVLVGDEKDGKRWVVVGDRLARVEKAGVDDLPWKPDDVLEAPPAPPPAMSLPDGGVAAAK